MSDSIRKALPRAANAVDNDHLVPDDRDALAAIRWQGYAEEDPDALLGRFGLAAASAPAPGS